ncbi:MAG: metallophosphoesterase [Clostridia bacterium]|nr:metallophosphoesterase [Clostridia bacterium]
MRLFAIGDLHLSGGDEKPMNVFGEHWEGHFERICADWRIRVADEDAVLIPGDFSWAMQLKDAVPDLQQIAALPGRKVFIKGNHDYWWSSLTQVKEAMGEGMTALQHTAVDLGPWVVCGTRGWLFPTPAAPLDEENEKVYRRELARLKLALDDAKRKAGDRPIVVMLHYPPLFDTFRDTEFTALLEAYHVHTAVYGHLHGAGIRAGFTGEHRGVRYALTSCDSLDFKLYELNMNA